MYVQYNFKCTSNRYEFYDTNIVLKYVYINLYEDSKYTHVMAQQGRPKTNPVSCMYNNNFIEIGFS